MTLKLVSPTKIFYSTIQHPPTIMRGVRGRPTSMAGHSTWTPDSPTILRGLQEADRVVPLAELLADPDVVFHAIWWSDGSRSGDEKHDQAKLRQFLSRDFSKPDESSLPYQLKKTDVARVELPEDAAMSPSVVRHLRVSQKQTIYEIIMPDQRVVRLVSFGDDHFTFEHVRGPQQ